MARRRNRPSFRRCRRHCADGLAPIRHASLPTNGRLVGRRARCRVTGPGSPDLAGESSRLAPATPAHSIDAGRVPHRGADRGTANDRRAFGLADDCLDACRRDRLLLRVPDDLELDLVPGPRASRVASTPTGGAFCGGWMFRRAVGCRVPRKAFPRCIGSRTAWRGVARRVDFRCRNSRRPVHLVGCHSVAAAPAAGRPWIRTSRSLAPLPRGRLHLRPRRGSGLRRIGVVSESDSLGASGDLWCYGSGQGRGHRRRPGSPR